MGSPLCKYFLTINDLYNGAKIVNLPCVVVEIWFFLNMKLWLLVWTRRQGQIGVMSRWRIDFVTIHCIVQELWFFWNIKLWFTVIRYLMSSWRHNICVIYTLGFKYVLSFKICMYFCRQSVGRKKKKRRKKHNRCYGLMPDQG